MSRPPPDGDVSLSEFEEAAQIVVEVSGFQLPPGIVHTNQNALRAAARDLGLPTRDLLVQLRARQPNAIRALLERTLIGETYFGRHREQFRALTREILPQLPSETVKLWSAACSSGEEAYDLAIAALDSGRRDAQVLGTDLSDRALDCARTGSYPEWSFRGLPRAERARHFQEVSRGRYEVKDEVRERVRFERHLLGQPAPVRDCHVIFCRNVLVYFSPQKAWRTVRSLIRALAPGGVMFFSPAEGPLAAAAGLVPVHFGPAIGWRQDGTSELQPRTNRDPRAPRARPPPQKRTSPPSPPSPTQAPHAQIGRTPLPPDQTFERAREAARGGHMADAEVLAREAAERELRPEAYQLLAMIAEARGDLEAAVGELRRALYLDPGLAQAHAALVPLLQRLGMTAEAERSRDNALRALEGLDHNVVLPGIEPVTADALRSALETRTSRRGGSVRAFRPAE